MSQNTDHYQLVTPPSSSSSSSSSNNQNNKRLPSHQQFLSSSSDFNTSSCTIQNDSSSPQSYTVRYTYIYIKEKKKKFAQCNCFFSSPLKKEQLYKRENETRHNMYSTAHSFSIYIYFV